jgi:hypothetical protein
MVVPPTTLARKNPKRASVAISSPPPQKSWAEARAKCLEVVRRSGNDNRRNFITLDEGFHRAKQDRTATQILREFVALSKAGTSPSRRDDDSDAHAAMVPRACASRGHFAHRRHIGEILHLAASHAELQISALIPRDRNGPLDRRVEARLARPDMNRRPSVDRFVNVDLHGSPHAIVDEEALSFFLKKANTAPHFCDIECEFRETFLLGSGCLGPAFSNLELLFLERRDLPRELLDERCDLRRAREFKWHSANAQRRLRPTFGTDRFGSHRAAHDHVATDESAARDLEIAANQKFATDNLTIHCK